MASHYWIKLYHEILDDPKMGRLPDHLWRRVIECFLMAGELQEGGYLPPLEDMSWRLRIGQDDLEAQLSELEKATILEQRDGRWFVSNFADRQSAMSASERAARWRERQRKQDYYENDTGSERQTNGERTPDERGANDSFADKEEDTEEEKEAARPREEHGNEGSQAAIQAYENNIGQLSKDLEEKILAWVDDVGTQWVIDAIQEAKAHGAYSWNYVQKILERWKVEGRGPRAGQNGQGDAAREAWTVVEAAIKKGRADPIMERPDVLETLNKVGRWLRVKNASEREISFIKKEFIEAYHE